MGEFPLACAGHIRTAEAVAEGVGEVVATDGVVVEDGVVLVGGEAETASFEDGDGARGVFAARVVVGTARLAQVVEKGADGNRLLGDGAAAFEHKVVDLERVVDKASLIGVVRAATCGSVVALAQIVDNAIHTLAVDALKYLDDSLHSS